MKRVLVVDDERKMRRVLQMMLEQMDLESLPAESGEEALDIFAAQKVDLVITDLHMPGMGGMECFKRLRALDAELPVIVLTAYGTIETAVKAMKLGAFDFILKPFDVEVVEAAVRNAWRSRRTARESLSASAKTEPRGSRISSGCRPRCRRSSSSSGAWRRPRARC
jgi:two-component system response regulator AtoC